MYCPSLRSKEKFPFSSVTAPVMSWSPCIALMFAKSTGCFVPKSITLPVTSAAIKDTLTTNSSHKICNRFFISVCSFSYYTMRAHVREQTRLPEGFTLGDIAYMHLHHRYLAFLHHIAQRYARMTVPACVEDDAVSFEVLDPINEVALMIGLLVLQPDLRPDMLDVQQNLCHTLGTVYLGFAYSEPVQVRSVEN